MGILVTPAPRKPQYLWEKIFSSPKFWIVFFVFGLGFPVIRGLLRVQPQPLPILAPMPNFKLVNQEGTITTPETFKSSVLAVQFLATSEKKRTPRMVTWMKEIQQRVLKTRPHIKLLTISLDPTFDTPEKLKKYGIANKVDFRQWSFLTATTKADFKNITKEFKVSGDPITSNDEIIVIDQIGRIRSFRKIQSEADINLVIADLALLLNSDPTRTK